MLCSRSQSANVTVQAGHAEGTVAMKVDEDTVKSVGKEPEPLDSSTIESKGDWTGNVLAGKPAVCEEASEMDVNTAAAAPQAIDKLAIDTVRCCSCLQYFCMDEYMWQIMHSSSPLALQSS